MEILSVRADLFMGQLEEQTEDFMVTPCISDIQNVCCQTNAHNFKKRRVTKTF